MMNSDQETLLHHAIKAMQATEPEAEQLHAAGRRVAERLGLYAADHSPAKAIESCEDLQQSLASYRAGRLANPQYLLMQAHLRECGVCHRYFSTKAGAASVDWSTPTVARAFHWTPRPFAWALAPTLALLALFFFLYRAFWQVPPGVRAEVQSIDGSAFLISEAGGRQLTPGDKLREGDRFRTTSGGHAVLRLADGSIVEVNERSLLGIGERGRNATITLDNGAVIVQATHRTAGHLYVRTPDCRVAVIGTVFSVDSGLKGSRVAVLEGSLHLTHAGADTLMHAGEQATTSVHLSPEPVAQQIAWSHDREKYLLLLAQFDTLQRRMDQIASPGLRYSSDLLQRVPTGSLLYVSIPNLGEFLSEANTVFNDQLEKSPALRQWWSGTGRKTEELNTLVDRLHQVSQYLGDEIVIVGLKSAASPDVAVIADVKQGGLESYLRSQPLLSVSAPRMTVFNEASLAATSVSTQKANGGFALVREHEVIFSGSIAALKQVNAQLNAGSSGFADSEFGRQIGAAYGRGAGMILAADLQQMLSTQAGFAHDGKRNDAAVENSGVRDLRYLIAEHRERDGHPENHLNLQFAGTRQRVTSWLAAPGPIGSLDFVTANASIAVAALSKDPAGIADDIMHMTYGDKAAANHDWTDAEAKLQVDIRNDLAANLGGDFLVSLDGPVLPTPAWKAVIEVRDADRLEQSIERLVTAGEKSAATEAGAKSVHRIAISSVLDGSQRFYALREIDSGATIAQYTYCDGYMIVAQDHAVLLQAMRAHASGGSLARSEAFKALLPTDENANYSAVAYQNLRPVLTPLLSQMSGALADAVGQMAQDARPTAICAWGKDSIIEAASNSHLLGFDLLALQALLHPSREHDGNKQAVASVRE